MQTNIRTWFLVTGILALPNLYYYPEYNVVLMLFIFMLWENPYRSTTLYLLILSWFVDIYRVTKQILVPEGNSRDLPGFIIFLVIVVFVMKLIGIILMIIFYGEARQALIPQQMVKNLRSTFCPDTKTDPEP